MAEKFICRQCKEEKQEDPRTLLKEERGFFILFTPLCESCLKELSSKSVEELFTIKRE